MNKVLSDERLGAKLRVTENRCVLFNSLTYVYIYIYIYTVNGLDPVVTCNSVV